MADNLGAQHDLLKNLLADGKISQEEFDQAADLVQSGRKPIEALKELQVLSSEEYAQTLADTYQLPYIDLRGVTIDQETLNLIPAPTAQTYLLICFERTDKTMKVAMVNPDDFQAQEAVEFIAGNLNLSPEIYVTTQESFEAASRLYTSLKMEVGRALEDVGQEFAPEEKIEELSGKEVEKLIEQAPVSKAVNIILSHAVEGRASDIHIEPMEKEVRVRYRIDGVLQTSLILPSKTLSAIVARIKVLANLKLDETRIPQDGRFNMKIAGRSIDFRVSTLPLATGEKVVLRILDKTEGAISLENLGLSGRNLKIYKETIGEPFGMILVTGPTGSGKSTTLYSTLSLLNKEGVNIVTLEDPVEYFIDGVNQSQVNPQVGLTFASGLRSILRQDPDIIMVGEIRDQDTAEMAVHSALTGHLMFSTLHTNTAVGSIPRLVDMGIEPFLLAASLSMVVGQRLVRKICQECKVEAKVSDAVRKDIHHQLAQLSLTQTNGLDLENLKFYQGQGCRFCGGKGYSGRIGVFEVLSIDERIRDLILNHKSPEDIFKVARKDQGMITMREDGLLKVARGLTTIEEVLRVT